MPKTGQSTRFGLTEEELREQLVDELVLSMRTEGNVPTLHAIAHSVARVLGADHLRMADQLEQAGIELDPPPAEPTG